MEKKNRNLKIKKNLKFNCAVPVFVFFLFLILTINNVVFATTTTVNVGFEDGLIGQPYIYPGYFYTGDGKGTCLISGSNFRNGLKSLRYEADVTGLETWFNFTYSGSLFLTGIGFYPKFPSLGGNFPTVYMNFTNSSTSNVIVSIRMIGNSNDWIQFAWRESSGTWNNFGTQIKEGSYYQPTYINFTSNQTLTYWSNGTGETGTVFQTGVTDFRIDSICFFSTNVVADWNIDDMNIIIGSSYDELGGGGEYQCLDTSDYEIIDHVNDFDTFRYFTDEYYYFQSPTSISSTLTAFEISVHTGSLPEDDFDLYGLYINDIYLGQPDCSYEINSRASMLQWDLLEYSLILNNSKPEFIIQSGDENFCLEYDNLLSGHFYSGPDDSMLFGSSYGVWSRKELISPNWNLYFTDFVDEPCDTENLVTLSYVDGSSLPVHPVYNKKYSYEYETIFIRVDVDEINKYNLTINNTGGAVAFSQGFPKRLYTCGGIFGWTPFDIGNYTISLQDGDGFFLNETVCVLNSTEDFYVWTSPNPSGMYSNFIIGSFSNSPEDYPYYRVAIFYSLEDVNNINMAYYVDVVNYDSGYWYSKSISLSTDFIKAYVRLFGTFDNDSFFPITSPYIHNIESYSSDNYINSDLPNNQGSIDVEFHLVGRYNDLVTAYGIWDGNNNIGYPPDVIFSVPVVKHQKGTYVFYLKEYKSGDWYIVDSVTVIIKDTSDVSEGSEYAFFSIFAGLGVVVGFSVSPIFIFRRFKNFDRYAIFVCSIFGLMGLGLSIWASVLPFWLAFLVALCIVGILSLKIYRMVVG